MKKISLIVMSLIAATALTVSASMHAKDCCNGGACCKGGSCCKTHHVK